MPYIRPTVKQYNFVQGNDAKLYVMRSDLHNRRITCTWGTKDRSQTKVFTFTTRDEARAKQQEVLDTRARHGYRVVRKNLLKAMQ